MSACPRILLLHNGPKPESVNQLHGNFDVQIGNCLEAYGINVGTHVALDMVRTFDEGIEKLPDVDGSKYVAVILSGSKFDVTQGLPWMHVLTEWLRVNIGKVPMLGICFGHQIIAHTLGGEVCYNPRGCEVGTYEMSIVDAAAQAEAMADPLVSQLPTSFKGVLIHRQSVERLPEGAVAFYRTELEKHQLVRFAPHTYGTQFHPEYTDAFVRSLMPFMTYGVSSEADAFRLSQMEPTPMSMSVVGRFVQLYLQRQVA